MRFRFILYTLRPNQEKVKSKASFFLAKQSVLGTEHNAHHKSDEQDNRKKDLPVPPHIPVVFLFRAEIENGEDGKESVRVVIQQPELEGTVIRREVD